MFSLLVGGWWWSRGVRTAAADATRGADLQIAAAVHIEMLELTTLLLIDITCSPSSRHGVSVSWAIGPRERRAREVKKKNSRRASWEGPAPVGMRQTLLVDDERDGTWKRSLCVDSLLNCSNGLVEAYVVIGIVCVWEGVMEGGSE